METLLGLMLEVSPSLGIEAFNPADPSDQGPKSYPEGLHLLQPSRLAWVPQEQNLGQSLVCR